MTAEPLLEFREVMRRLRAECPWKQQQTHRSLVRYLVEELHETVDAIESGTSDDLREELGDVLLQVYFHAAIAEESGSFTLDDVAAGIVDKMVRRNPHVFGEAGAQDSAAEVNELWESVKAAEKRRDDVTDGLAPTLPTLLHADKVLDRLARAGAPVTAAPLVVLVHSPMLGPSSWTPVAWWLRGRGCDVEVVGVDGVVGAVEAAAGRPVVLVPHSGAGLHVARLTGPSGPTGLDGVDVLATVHVDAALPPVEGGEVPVVPPALLAAVAPLADDGLLPGWTRWWDDADLAGLFPDAATRAAVEAEQPRVRLDDLRRTVTVPPGWATAPAAYLALGSAYADELALARAQGWPVEVLEGAHLHALVDPPAVGAAVLRLLDRLTPLPTSLGDRLLAAVGDARSAGLDPDQALRDAVHRLLARAR